MSPETAKGLTAVREVLPRDHVGTTRLAISTNPHSLEGRLVYPPQLLKLDEELQDAFPEADYTDAVFRETLLLDPRNGPSLAGEPATPFQKWVVEEWKPARDARLAVSLKAVDLTIADMPLTVGSAVRTVARSRNGSGLKKTPRWPQSRTFASGARRSELCLNWTSRDHERLQSTANTASKRASLRKASARPTSTGSGVMIRWSKSLSCSPIAVSPRWCGNKYAE